MPLDPNLMTDAIVAHMPPLAEKAARDAQRASILAFATGIIEHFVAAGVVTIIFGPTPPASVVSSSPTGGPVVGTGIGKIT